MSTPIKDVLQTLSLGGVLLMFGRHPNVLCRPELGGRVQPFVF